MPIRTGDTSPARPPTLSCAVRPLVPPALCPLPPMPPRVCCCSCPIERSRWAVLAFTLVRIEGGSRRIGNPQLHRTILGGAEWRRCFALLVFRSRSSFANGGFVCDPCSARWSDLVFSFLFLFFSLFSFNLELPARPAPRGFELKSNRMAGELAEGGAEDRRKEVRIVFKCAACAVRTSTAWPYEIDMYDGI